MARSFNEITIIGRLGADPEIKTLENGDQVGRLSVATSESWKDSTGEWQERTHWHQIVTFSKFHVENSLPKLKKGIRVHLRGEMRYRSYTKGEVKHTVAEIIVSDFVGFIHSLDKVDKSES